MVLYYFFEPAGLAGFLFGANIFTFAARHVQSGFPKKTF